MLADQGQQILDDRPAFFSQGDTHAFRFLDKYVSELLQHVEVERWCQYLPALLPLAACGES